MKEYSVILHDTIQPPDPIDWDKVIEQEMRNDVRKAFVKTVREIRKQSANAREAKGDER